MTASNQTGSLPEKNWIGWLIAGLCLVAVGYLAIGPVLWCTEGLSDFSPSYRDRGMLSDSAGRFWALVFGLISDILSAVLLLIPIALVCAGCFFIMISIQHALLGTIVSIGVAALLIAIFHQLIDGSMRFSYWEQNEYVWPVIKQTIYFAPLFLGTCGALFAILVMSGGDANGGDDATSKAQNGAVTSTVDATGVILFCLTPIILIYVLIHHFQDKIGSFQDKSTSITCCASSPASHSRFVMASQSPKLKRLFVDVTENGSQLQGHLDLAMQNKNLKEIRLEYRNRGYDKTALNILSRYPLKYAGVAHDPDRISRHKSFPTSTNNTIAGISIQAVEYYSALSRSKTSPYAELRKLQNLRNIELDVGLLRIDRKRDLLSYLLGPDAAKFETLALSRNSPFRGEIIETEYLSTGSKVPRVKRLIYNITWDTRGAETLKEHDRYVSKVLKKLFPSLQEIVFFVHRNNAGEFTHEPLREIVERHGIRCVFVKDSYPQSLEVLFETNWADYGDS